MNARQLVIWCGIGSGTAALFWMCNVLLLTGRISELVAVCLLGAAAMALLSRQARRVGCGFGAYFGFAVAGLCTLLAVVVALDMLTVSG